MAREGWVLALLIAVAAAGCVAPGDTPNAGTGDLILVQYVSWDVLTGQHVESSFEEPPTRSPGPDRARFAEAFGGFVQGSRDAADRVLHALDQLDSGALSPAAVHQIAQSELRKAQDRRIDQDAPPGLGQAVRHATDAQRPLRQGLEQAEACAAQADADCLAGRDLLQEAKDGLEEAVRAIPPDAFRRPVSLETAPDAAGRSWVLLWNRDAAKRRSGQGVLVDVTIKDLDRDGVADSVIQSRSDVTVESGRRLVKGEVRTFHRIPGTVGDVTVTSPGLAEALRGRPQGETALNVPVPEAYRPSDPDQISELPRRLDGLPRDRTNLSRATVVDRSTLDASTQEGDVVEFRLAPRDSPVPARVTNLTDDTVSLRLLVEEGMQIRSSRSWDTTVVSVDDRTFAVRRDPEVGAVYHPEGRRARVMDRNATHFAVDFGEAVAGRLLAYDVRILDIRPDALTLVGRSETPFRYQNHIHDIVDVNGIPMIATHYDLKMTFNNGSDWLSFSPALDEEDVTAVAAGPQGHRFYASTVEDGLLVSSDTGRTWRSDAEGLPSGFLDTIAVAGGDPSVVYALHEEGTVYRSRDHGATWSRRGAPPSPTEIAADPDDPERVWAGTDQGLYRSSDGGASWHLVGLEDRDVGDVVPQSGGPVYALVDGCLAKSAAPAGNWTELTPAGRPLLDLIEPTGVPGRLLGAKATGQLAILLDEDARRIAIPTGAPQARTTC